MRNHPFRILSVVTLIVLTGFLVAPPTKVFAQDQFETQYSVKYTVDATGDTSVEQDISIINKQKDILATNYVLTVKQMEIYDITAQDKKGDLTTTVNTANNETSIKVALRNQAIGEGKKNDFSLFYKSKFIAAKVGEIWNINIPPVEASSATTKYDVTLSVPQAFGPKIYISPSVVGNDDYELKFTKDQINGRAISASYGSYQVINFDLKYDLRNDGWLPVFQEIALPPQIANAQQLLYKSIQPAPNSIKTDADGNVLALYRLFPKQKIGVELIGSARMLGSQIDPQAGGKMAELKPEMIRDYTNNQKYWETDSPQIQSLAKSLFDGNKNVSQNTQAVYEYVTKNLHYDFNVSKEDFVDRKGAMATLSQSTKLGACMEFSDLFIAITRAMGIPSRELNGYAFSNADANTPLSVSLKNGDLLHAWPEYYDPVFGWVAVDPTWGSTSGVDYFTKLDTNHFVFSILGLNSEYPFPAGAYRFDDSGKQVEVAFAQDSSALDFKDIVMIQKQFTFNIFQMFKGNSKYRLTNTGGTILYDVQGSGQTLLPFSYIDVYIPNNQTSFTYKDFKGNVQRYQI